MGNTPTHPPLDAGLFVEAYDVQETAADPVTLPDAPPGNNSTLLWGYEAGWLGSRLLSYDISPFAPRESCVPDRTGNGRGVAFDPLDGNLWYSRLTTFAGDGYIHKTTPPHLGCRPAGAIPFGDGPFGTVQDDIGAIDVDEATKHIWVAGYMPVTLGDGIGRAYLYLVNRNNGKIIHVCWTPSGGSPGNTSLTSAKIVGLPGSSKDLLTDAGGDASSDPIRVIEQDSCHSGEQAQVVATFSKKRDMTAMDFNGDLPLPRIARARADRRHLPEGTPGHLPLRLPGRRRRQRHVPVLTRAAGTPPQTGLTRTPLRSEVHTRQRAGSPSGFRPLALASTLPSRSMDVLTDKRWPPTDSTSPDRSQGVPPASLRDFPCADYGIRRIASPPAAA